MTAPTTHRPPSVRQLEPRRPRGRTLVAAAAAAAVVAAGAAVVLSSDSDEQALPPAEDAQEQVLTGLLGLPQFPLRMTVPADLVEDDQDAGSRAFSLRSGEPGGIIISALRSVDGTPAADLPADVTAAIADRTDVVVSDRDSRTVDGRTAQAFRVSIAPGQQPRDLWCPIVEVTCFKLDADKPMDVLVVQTAAQPLWIATEYTSATETAVKGLADRLIEAIELPDANRVDVAGASVSLPVGWTVDARTERYAQAGNPARRASEGVNVVVPASVVAADGARIATPDDLLGWLRARAGLDVQVLQAVDVDGRNGTVVRVAPQAGSQTLWCGGPATATETGSCFNTGGGSVLYLLVPYGQETLVLERHSALVDGGLTPAELQQWVDSHLELARAVELG